MARFDCDLRNDIAKFELSPLRGRTKRVAIALIVGCQENNTETTPPVTKKVFSMDKLQILEPEMELQAIATFQKLRRLTMRLNPVSEEEPKSSLDLDESHCSPFKKARTLCVMPTDESLKDTGP